MTDLAVNVVKEEHLPVEENDDSCIFKYFEVVPLATDTDVSSTTNVPVEMVLLNSNKKT